MNDIFEQFILNKHSIVNFLKETDENAATLKPDENTWSVIECMEHIIVSEKGILKLFNRPDLFSSEHSPNTEALNTLDDRKLIAPEFIRPTGRFSSIEEQIRTFNQIRSGIETWIENEYPQAGEETYPHPVLGPITKNQWLNFVLIHSERHLRQMEGIVERIEKEG